MKKITIVALMYFLVGCAVAPLTIEVSDLNKSESVTVTDLRPDSESEKTVFSLLITSDAYAIYRNNDEVTIPTSVRLLQHKAHEKLSGNTKPVDIKLYHFVSYTNAQSTLRAGAVGSIFGAIGAGIATASKNQDANFSYSVIDSTSFESIPEDKEYTKAYFSAAENPNDATVFILYLDAEVNGSRKMIRTVAPAVIEGDDQPYVTALEKTIDTFLTSLDT